MWGLMENIIEKDDIDYLIKFGEKVLIYKWSKSN